MSYTVINNFDFTDISISNNLLTIDFIQDKFGFAEIELLANDGQLSVSTTFDIEVLPVNDAPTVEDIALEVDEDSEVDFTLIASDIDGDDLEYNIDQSALNGSVTWVGNIATFVPDLNFNGNTSFTYTVTDGFLTNTGVVAITVNPINDAPISNDLNAIIDEDQDAVISLDGSDIDGDDITYILVQDSSDGFVSIDGSTATFTPDDNFNGTTTFTYLVTDGELTSSTSIVTIIVSPVNDAPVLSSVEDQSIDEDNDLVISLSANDVDGDVLTYSASVDGNSTSSVDGNILTVSPDADYNGSIVVDVLVTDGDLTDSLSFTLVVNPVNDAPILSVIEDQSIDEDSDLILQLLATDIDTEDLTYSASIDGNGSVSVVSDVLTVTPNLNYNGDIEVSVTVSDGQYIDTQSFTLSIQPINDAPTVEDIALEVDEDSEVDFTLIASDIDGDDLEYNIDQSALNGSVTWVGNIATFVPDLNFNGNTSFTYTVTDGFLTSNTGVVAITVNPINDAPISNDLNAIIDEDQDAVISLDGSDIDGDDITYILVQDSSDGFVSIDGSTATFTLMIILMERLHLHIW